MNQVESFFVAFVSLSVTFVIAAFFYHKEHKVKTQSSPRQLKLTHYQTLVFPDIGLVDDDL